MITRTGTEHLSILFEHLPVDTDQEIVRLSLTVDNLRKTGPRIPVHVQLGVPHLLDAASVKQLLRLCDTNLTVLHFFQYFPYIRHSHTLLLVHLETAAAHLSSAL